jgi:hypothetical protein
MPDIHPARLVAHQQAELCTVSIENRPVSLNIRESAIACLAARRVIQHHQLKAALKFQWSYEALHRSALRAVRFDHDAVDAGQRNCGGLTDMQMKASKTLRQARQVLGARNYEIIVHICGEGHGLDDLASSRREKATLTDVLRASLDDLAFEWRFAVRKGRRGALK